MNQDANLHIERHYSLIYLALLRGPKDGTHMTIEGSHLVSHKERRRLYRAMRARVLRSDYPYKLRAKTHKILRFFWEELEIPEDASDFERKQHQLNKERMKIDVEMGWVERRGYAEEL